MKCSPLLLSLYFLAFALPAFSQVVCYQINSETGAISKLQIENDGRSMNWIMETDGSQYPWITEKYGWGLGYFSTLSGTDTIVNAWSDPIKMINKGKECRSIYKVGDIQLNVVRTVINNDLVEEYTFLNESKQPVNMFDIGIITPFNDNYPDAATCFNARMHAHIWAGKNAAYVNATHMSGNPPHLGLVLTKGSINGYEVKERGVKKGMSNTRGVIILNPEDIVLQPNNSYTISWRIFKHTGNDEFFQKIIKYGSAIARSDKYIYELGERARIEFEYSGAAQNVRLEWNGQAIPFKKLGNIYIIEPRFTSKGEMKFEMVYDNGKRSPLYCFVVSNKKELIRKRANFIVKHQQMNNTNDKRYGAYMVYDNEGDSIYLNDTPNCNPVDRDEARERLGMGVLLAILYHENKDEKIKESLLKYSEFVHKLQDEEYNTYSNTDLKGWNRNYNYSWVANFYFEMFRVTGEKQYLLDGYKTLKALYRNFGHGFYAIDMPTKGYYLLKENGYPEEAASLLHDFREVGDAYLKNGVNYPTSEVNYEQSIVAPSITHLLRLYLITKEQKYLDGAQEQLPLLEAFSGFQPSYHLNEVAIRHWDGYWFGKREFWGDTFPHYWSTLTAVAYDLYAEVTGDISYRQRAQNIVRNNLCLFFEDGKASCAFIYPNKVNEKKASFYDPYGNDQDWALVYYLMINRDENEKY